jgi:hypothetical protein
LAISESDEPGDEDSIENIEFLDDGMPDRNFDVKRSLEHEPNIEGRIVVADD